MLPHFVSVHGSWQSVCVVGVRKMKDDVVTPEGVIRAAVTGCQVANTEAVTVFVHDHSDQANLLHPVELRAVIIVTWTKVVHHRPEEFNGDH